MKKFLLQSSFRIFGLIFIALLIVLVIAASYIRGPMRTAQFKAGLKEAESDIPKLLAANEEYFTKNGHYYSFTEYPFIDYRLKTPNELNIDVKALKNDAYGYNYDYAPYNKSGKFVSAGTDVCRYELSMVYSPFSEGTTALKTWKSPDHC